MNKWQNFKSSEEFKARINELLSDKSGVTKKDIALEMGVDFRSLSNAYNYGIIPRPMTLAKIADYFNVSIDYLLGRSENDYFVKGKANDNFYDRYTALRDELKVTDYQIAASLHFDRTLCYKWKSKGHIPTLEVIDLLCEYFDVSADYLLGRTDIK